jgi:hypothetical protein
VCTNILGEEKEGALACGSKTEIQWLHGFGLMLEQRYFRGIKGYLECCNASFFLEHIAQSAWLETRGEEPLMFFPKTWRGFRHVGEDENTMTWR